MIDAPSFIFGMIIGAIVAVILLSAVSVGIDFAADALKRRLSERDIARRIEPGSRN